MQRDEIKVSQNQNGTKNENVTLRNEIKEMWNLKG